MTVAPASRAESTGSGTAEARPPEMTATYRLQLHHAMPLAAAVDIVPYLARLGITHAYTAPVLQARPGSLHGYDVTDPSRLNPELGTESDRRMLARRLRDHRMGWVLDVVPNHMATGHENPYWQDVLAHGRASAYARWFDVDWELPARRLRGRIVLPVLAESLDEALGAGKIALRLDDGRIVAVYGSHRLPIDPAALSDVLSLGLDRLHDLLGGEHPAMREMDEIVDEMASLPPRWTGDPRTAAQRRERAEEVAERFAALCRSSDAIAAHFARAIERFGAGPDGLDRMRTLLQDQAYQLAYWREGLRRVNYRRFFDVTELAGIRVEDPEVFAATHRLPLQWVAEGTLDALRIDHIDGLRDPDGYLDRLRETLDRIAPGRHVPIIVEKILTGSERLREHWPVAGTTGYEFIAESESVFVDPAGRDALAEFFRGLAGGRTPRRDFDELAYECKRVVLGGALSPDVERVTRLLVRAATMAQATMEEGAVPSEAEDPPPSPRRLRSAVLALAAALPVYRTYFGARRAPLPDDATVTDAALDRVRGRGAIGVREAKLLRRVLIDPGPAASQRATEGTDPWLEFVLRFQQLTGPAAAKGIEDTALYRDVALASLSEVGCAPNRPLESAVAELHRANGHRAERWPRGLLAVTTHDTKRSGDVRSRLDVLSEMPAEWIDAIRRWRRRHARFRQRVGRRTAPDGVTQYLLYQSALGIWPLGSDGGERLRAYIVKAAREAKSRTNWLEPDAPFERALGDYVSRVLDEPEFGAEMDALARRIIPCGWWNSLARIVIQMASPGVADVYQGDELWNLSLVDPDNRRPVDYELRSRLLEEMSGASARAAPPPGLVADAGDGRIKMWVVHRALRARRDMPDLFTRGACVPLSARGTHAAHVVAFERRKGHLAAVAVVPRLVMRLAGAEPPMGERWMDTEIEMPSAPEEWTCALSGRRAPTGRLRLAEALGTLPVALFISGARAPG